MAQNPQTAIDNLVYEAIKVYFGWDKNYVTFSEAVREVNANSHNPFSEQQIRDSISRLQAKQWIDVQGPGYVPCRRS